MPPVFLTLNFNVFYSTCQSDCCVYYFLLYFLPLLFVTLLNLEGVKRVLIKVGAVDKHKKIVMLLLLWMEALSSMEQL